ncbi:MAG: deoxyguanosinetriphosphate triphosphohydrolase [Gammaproteobacteria bacterium]|nr:deoxyguanosinetriphosphate triphosphohydrolase [Gammaproteobacteria bacterium]MDH5653998.1 deoxyguanosinetriphosphate triphosphohydrolase [Gammaproteobacteria bacterium]
MPDFAAYAAQEQHSRGRRVAEDKPVYRTEYQRDRDRIIHSAAFRRLEYKTQVFVNHEGDMFRTRLTHSIEVAQLSRSIARILQLNEDLAETIALAHDLGHTPFGHAGQDALNACMKEYGGFEHNLQSLRVVDELEERYAAFRGLNLTFEAREGILKHCSLSNAKLLGDVGQRFIDKHQPGLEAQIVNLADQIAYNNHDVDDGLRAGLLSIKQLREIKLFDAQYTQVKQTYPELAERRMTHEIIRRMINVTAIDLIDTTRRQLAQLKPANIDEIRRQSQPTAGFSEAMRDMNHELKQFLRHNLYRHYRVHRMTSKASRILSALFDAFLNDIGLLPHDHQTFARQYAEQHGDSGRARAVADYIAGMTDRFAITEYERIFNPAELT